MNPSTLPAPPLAEIYDVAVIGGGINGVGIAADAAGRGLSVFLCEKDDLASHTSSASSKLIHGGLRYLEHYEFRLVREALAEREVLLAKAPHIVKQMRFVLPHRPHLRPAWMIRAGLFLYDHLGKREKLAGSKSLKFGADSPLKSEITKGFEYSDCWVDDARLVVLNAMAAREKGAHIHTQTRCISAHRSNGMWDMNMERADGSLFSIRARALVNAAGPWVAKFIKDDLKLDSPYGIRLIQGSHLIVPKLYEGAHAHILQNEDQRIVFTIPYLSHLTIIGTTDRELSRDDIVHTYSGVRPLCNDESDNPSAITRDYTLSLSGGTGEAPILSVFGGKLTTYRKLAESAMAQLAPYFTQMRPSWTAKASLPGGEDMTTPEALAEAIRSKFDWVPGEIARRWSTTYGSRTWRLLEGVQSLADLGDHLGGGLYTREVDYLCAEEWVTQPQDVLWRRTKLGLFTTPQEQDNLQRYLSQVEQNRSKIQAA
jgi:glycerol-3-phosphate dehydrogenase